MAKDSPAACVTCAKKKAQLEWIDWIDNNSLVDWKHKMLQHAATSSLTYKMLLSASPFLHSCLLLSNQIMLWSRTLCIKAFETANREFSWSRLPAASIKMQLNAFCFSACKVHQEERRVKSVTARYRTLVGGCPSALGLSRELYSQFQKGFWVKVCDHGTFPMFIASFPTFERQFGLHWRYWESDLHQPPLRHHHHHPPVLRNLHTRAQRKRITSNGRMRFGVQLIVWRSTQSCIFAFKTWGWLWHWVWFLVAWRLRRTTNWFVHKFLKV